MPGLLRRTLPVLRGAEAAECGLACLTMVAPFPRPRRRPERDAPALPAVPVGLDAAFGHGSVRPARIRRPGHCGSALSRWHACAPPAILHWDMNHFVVLKAVRRNGVVVHDPALGRRAVGRTELSKRFTGVALELAPAADMKPVHARVRARFRDLWSRIDGLWPALAQIVGLSAALQVAVFAAPFYLQLTVDEAIQSGDRDLTTVLALGFGGLVAIQVGIAALRSWAPAVHRLPRELPDDRQLGPPPPTPEDGVLREAARRRHPVAAGVRAADPERHHAGGGIDADRRRDGRRRRGDPLRLLAHAGRVRAGHGGARPRRHPSRSTPAQRLRTEDQIVATAKERTHPDRKRQGIDGSSSSWAARRSGRRASGGTSTPTSRTPRSRSASCRSG